MELLTAVLAQDYTYPTIDYSTSTTDSTTGGFILIFILVFYLFALIFAIFKLMSYYHWGTTDSQYFDDGIHTKRMWFWIFFLPLSEFFYFFGVRPRVNERKNRGNSSQFNGGFNGGMNNQGFSAPAPQPSYGMNNSMPNPMQPATPPFPMQDPQVPTPNIDVPATPSPLNATGSAPTSTQQFV